MPPTPPKLQIARLDSRNPHFARDLQALRSQDALAPPEVAQTVAEILHQVRQRGDAALLEYSRQHDRHTAASIAELEVPPDQLAAAAAQLDPDLRRALQQATQRIEDFHRRQLQQSWSYRDNSGNRLGQQVRALARVGIYVPGGKASYPSSVLMNAIPARVAGVDEIIMVSPAPNGTPNPAVLAAAHLVGVDRVFQIGGAQAVAALAYGTASLPAVDKIVGPGNIYVATAKQLLYGTVGIDMLAGPSEILIICDGHTPPDWIALDLFSQAEHDEQAQAILISPDAPFLDQVAAAMQDLLPKMHRAAIIRQSLQAHGALIRSENLDEAIALANRLAPEHLELSLANAESYLPQVQNAGAIFLGPHTPEAFGDYCAGPNHVLPTAGTARFASPLGVDDFQKRSSIIGCSPSGAQELAKIAATLAHAEGLQAHALAAERRSASS
ncbi:MAG: histidinol dehydrogenase [Cellvibrionales bacterium]|nr:histidinol dehydrogenase [Cellvibrionales bacterium]